MYFSLDEATISNLQYYMPEDKTLRQLSNIFYVFADETRLKILSALALSEMCVNDMSKYLKINQTTISHQLRILKDLGVVNDCRKGKSIIYSIKDKKILEIISLGVDYIFK